MPLPRLCRLGLRRICREDAPESPLWPPVTILKPLRGDEPALFRNLASFCSQDYPAPVQIVFGVQAPDDPAIEIVERLECGFPGLRHTPGRRLRDAWRKSQNLQSDQYDFGRQTWLLGPCRSDIEAPRDYLRRVAAALDQPGVGGVTCLYHGVADGGFWSRVSALGIDAHFLPNVLFGLRSGMATPCFGSTIALRRGDLDAIGGLRGVFQSSSPTITPSARPVRAKGLKVAVPSFLVGHSCAETSLAEVWRRELRWARTIRTLDPWGHAGSAVTHPFAFALLAAATGAPVQGLALAVLAIACRVVLLHVTARTPRLAPSGDWLVPLRDLLSFAIFVWSFCGQ